MSPREVQLVDAAASIAFARCARNGACQEKHWLKPSVTLWSSLTPNLYFRCVNAEYTAEHDYVNQSSRSTGSSTRIKPHMHGAPARALNCGR